MIRASAACGGWGGVAWAGACIEGMLSSAAPFVAVIDADLQHDEKVLPLMLGRLKAGEADLIAGTRYGGAAAPPAFPGARFYLPPGHGDDKTAGRHRTFRSHVRLLHDAP